MICFLLSVEKLFPCLSSDINQDAVADYPAHGVGPEKDKFQVKEI